MNSAAEQKPRASAGAAARSEEHKPGIPTLVFRIALALTLIAAAANCFLKYLWWTASYSAWSGLPKFAEQAKTAGANASFNGWSLIALELASIPILYTAISLRQVTFSRFLRTGLRLAASLVVTIVGTGLLAFVLAWVKQSH